MPFNKQKDFHCEGKIKEISYLAENLNWKSKGRKRVKEKCTMLFIGFMCKI